MAGCALFLLTIVCANQLVKGQSQQLLSEASFRFSQRLYSIVGPHRRNIVYSPYSIHSVLSLTYYGARGKTALQMEKTLALTAMHGNSIHTAYHQLIQKMTSSKVELLTANALFMNGSYAILPAFANMARNHYFSDTFHLAHVTPERAINDYVAKKTHDNIREIVAKGAILKSTALIIVGTFFFNGTWARSFDAKRTHRKSFHMQNGGRDTHVHMMAMEGVLPFKRDDKQHVEVLELPFVDKRFGLFIMLPYPPDTISDLETLLTSYAQASTLFNDLKPTHVHVEVPKFKIKSTLPLKNTLCRMGMKDAFLPRAADFRGISHTNPFISEVEHRAVIDVQETGTVASAATLVHVGGRSRLGPSQSFIANHPFIFFLRDKETKMILFQGKFSGNMV